MLPHGKRYLENRIQFVHVDDVARLIACILRRNQPEAQRLTVLNVAGRGEALRFRQCIDIAQAKLWQVPGKQAFRLVLQGLWKLGISAIPPEALPYMTGEYIMSTERLQKFLGSSYEDVIRYTITDAFADSFRSQPSTAAQPAAAMKM
jgi:nucleoside-diphosphate-sugar epimerase